jgi:ribonucrease Y
MDLWAIIAGLGVLIIAAPASFIFGQKRGRAAELARQKEARATAEELSKRIVADAEREADNLKKTALVSGKEEVIKLREHRKSSARNAGPARRSPFSTGKSKCWSSATRS